MLEIRSGLQSSLPWRISCYKPAPDSNKSLLKGFVKEYGPIKLQSANKLDLNSLSRQMSQTSSGLQTSCSWRVRKGAHTKPAPGSNEPCLNWAVKKNASKQLQPTFKPLWKELWQKMLQTSSNLPSNCSSSICSLGASCQWVMIPESPSCEYACLLHEL